MKFSRVGLMSQDDSIYLSNKTTPTN